MEDVTLIDQIISLISKHIQWLFSGVGVVIFLYFFNKYKGNDSSAEQHSKDINLMGSSKLKKKTLDDYKNETKILFIDDDARFKVVKILVNSGWVHTKLIKDCKTLDEQSIVEADILFVDVQGVGVALSFSDEGLGLALAIKQKYSDKKVVIYSAETKGDRFHQALREADYFLPKNADPYEFQSLVEEYTINSEDV